MERDVVTAQFVAGLHGLGLLRSWPFLDAADAEARLVSLERAAGARVPESLDVLDTGPGYAAWSSTYDDRVNPLLVAEHPAISEVLDSIPAGRALDAACGTGRITRLLVERGHDVTGVDASEEMLDRARLTAPEATYQVASMQRLPFQDATFDLVCCGLALTHVAALGIRRICRVSYGMALLLIAFPAVLAGVFYVVRLAAVSSSVTACNSGAIRPQDAATSTNARCRGGGHPRHPDSA